MDITKKSIIEIIKKECTNIQIPYFQRNYVWEEREIINLLNDIYKYAEKPNEYFIGSIIFLNKGMKRILIDGQQRISSICIILAALCEVLQNEKEVEKIKDILKNLEFESYNILDKGGLKDILDLKFTMKKTRYYENFKLVKDWLNNNPDKIENVSKNIHNLFCSYSVFDGNINENILFSKINSTGKKLSAYDMIKNYLLSGYSEELEEKGFTSKQIDDELLLKNDLFNNIWEKLDKDNDKLDNMIRFFICSKVYKLYKNDTYILFEKFIDTINEIKQSYKYNIDDLIKFAYYFTYLNNENYWSKNKNENNKIAKPMLIISSDLNTFMPILIKTFYEFSSFYENEIIIDDIEQLHKSLKIIEYYIINFKFNSQRTKTITRYIPKILRDIEKRNNNLKDYIVSLYYYLIFNNKKDKSEKSYTIPDEIELKNNFLKNNMYKNLTKFTKAFLIRIATLDNPITKDEFKNNSIEHVMPQKIDIWRENGFNISDIDFIDYVHRIGNLTLTNHNSEYSNSVFLVKKEKMFQIENNNLNIYFLDKNKWDKEDIDIRSNFIFEKLVKNWNFASFEKELESFQIDNDCVSREFLNNSHSYENIEKNLIYFKKTNLISYESLKKFKTITNHFLVDGMTYEKIEKKLFNKTFDGWIPCVFLQYMKISKSDKKSMTNGEFEIWWDNNKKLANSFIEYLIELDNQ